MKIASLVFGGGISTLGMDVVQAEIESKHGKRVEFIPCRPEDVVTIKSVDVLMVSLYWFDNILDFLEYLWKAGIDPRKRKPLIIIGGIAATNIRILKGYFHYCVLGDGEMVAADLVSALLDGSDPASLPHVISDGDFDSIKTLATNPNIPARAYTELRGSRTARIEIARGCRFKCPFCQLAHTKPYREQPLEVIEHILKGTQTKSVGLFAPDRTGYSRYDELEKTCRRIGKNNTAEDARLDMLMRKKVVNKVKFGVEGFSAKTRKGFRKIPTNEMLIKGFNHIFNVLRTPKGKSITTATVYMIGDLPGEGRDEVNEFWETMFEVDKHCPGKFTLFLTLNSFSPKPYTPMERCGINPYNDWREYWEGRPKLPKITIASRGGMLGASNRIIHCMTARGDERLGKALFYLATEGRKIYRSTDPKAGKAVERLIKMSGVEPEAIWGEIDDSIELPHEKYKIDSLEK
jgi:radical SAM superfamily enzyme YgiQ (UPF0313 family)